MTLILKSLLTQFSLLSNSQKSYKLNFSVAETELLSFTSLSLVYSNIFTGILWFFGVAIAPAINAPHNSFAITTQRSILHTGR